MIFTRDQLEELKKFEKYFETAVKQAWCRYPGIKGLKNIYGIYTAATGDRRRLSLDCGTCILNLVRDCGTAYYKDIEEIEKHEKITKQEVELISKKAGSIRRVTVRTKRNGK